jgi:NHLM bacteriocin system ABC transporter ATP-binding protein
MAGERHAWPEDDDRHLMTWGDPTEVEAGMSRQVVLGGRETLWLVTGAALDVFAADTGDRNPWQFLGLLPPGALLAGSSRTARHVLAGHPQVGCTLRRLSLSELMARGDHPGLDDGAVADGVDATLTVLHRAIPPAGEPATVVTLGHGESELPAGEFARCPDGVWWVMIEHGLVLPGRIGRHREREAGEVVVVTAGDWIQAVTDARVVAYRTEDLLAHRQLWQYLVWHSEEYLRVVDEWIDAQRAERDRWVSAGTTAMAGMVARADESLRAAVLPTTQPPAPPDAGAEHAAQTACALVAKATGTEVPQARAEPSATTGDPVLPIAQASRLPARPVTLPARWWRQNMGPLVGYLGPQRRPVALLWRRRGYVADDVTAGRRRVTRELAEQFQPDAVMFYRKLPDKPMGGWRLTWFAVRGTRADVSRLFLGGVMTFLLGLGVPILSGKVLGEFVPQGRADLLVQACIAVLVASVVGASFSVLSSLALLRLEGRLDATLQAAVWDRLLRLPVSFYSRYTTGELANAAMGISTIRTVLSGIANAVFSASMLAVVNLGLMLWYDPLLGAFAVGLVVVHTTVFLVIRLRLINAQKQLIDLEYKLSNQVFQTLRGLPKLRVAAAEGFAYAHWGTSFARNRSLSLRVKRSQNLVAAVDVIYVPFGAMLLFALLAGPARGTLTVAQFLTFVTAFTIVLSAMSQITTAIATGGIVVPIFDKVKPVLNEQPEVAVQSTTPGRLSGDIDLAEVSFRYAEGAPLVLHNVSLHIRAGEFVAVVGATGCGKSTLLRLLIGFNQPSAGSVRFDGVALTQLDVAEVRRQCGIVLQHSAPFAGTVLRNICGPGSHTVDEAWEAARMAGLDEDIRKMPMGMQTLLSDGGTELSGGQRQRLMIAQALIRQPRILLFDEATSALDNATQSIVAESTRTLSVTRVVIAHRLSTIMHADRVVVMDRGRIVESGAPDELLADEKGMFAQLVERQRQ